MKAKPTTELGWTLYFKVQFRGHSVLACKPGHVLCGPCKSGQGGAGAVRNGASSVHGALSVVGWWRNPGVPGKTEPGAARCPRSGCGIICAWSQRGGRRGSRAGGPNPAESAPCTANPEAVARGMSRAGRVHSSLTMRKQTEDIPIRNRVLPAVRERERDHKVLT